ncbi:MAG: division/cell wall cluster transcriptional repressor MraZ [candidate division WOR-3 bacterium]
MVNNLFLGEFRFSVDAKGRVQVPVSYRERLSPESDRTFVLQRGRDRTIEVHPLSEWREYWDRTLQNLPKYQDRARKVRRLALASAAEVQMDSQYRLLIPKHLLEWAGISSEAVLAGAGEYFEIWEPGRYDQFTEEARQTLDEDLAELERHGWGIETGPAEPRSQRAEGRVQQSDARPSEHRS